MNKILVLLLLSTGVMLHSSLLASEAGAKPATTSATAASGGEDVSSATLATAAESAKDSEKALLRKIFLELTSLQEKFNTFIHTQAPVEGVVTAVVAQTEAVGGGDKAKAVLAEQAVPVKKVD